MSSSASVLHADLDSFYASVEQRDHPRLLGRPVAVGGGVVLAASYEAKAFGVTSAMGGRRAQALCPELVVVPPRFTAYLEASREVFRIFADTAPTVEKMSIDEAFLDVRGLDRISGSPAEIAVALRRRIRDEVDLPISVGVARTKFLAKVASGAAKPDGLLVVEPAGERDFLWPLPVQRLWGVGPKTAAKLHSCGMLTVADVARADEAALVQLLGRAQGRHLIAIANNRDPRPVRVSPRRRSIGAQHALGRRRRPFREIANALMALVDKVCRRLRSADRLCRTVVLRLRFDDYERATRSSTLSRATADTATVLATALTLLEAHRELISARGLTLVGVSLTNLCDRCGVQLELPLNPAAGLDAAVDQVRDRFGAASITRGSLLHHRGRDGIPDVELDFKASGDFKGPADFKGPEDSADWS